MKSKIAISLLLFIMCFTQFVYAENSASNTDEQEETFEKMISNHMCTVCLEYNDYEVLQTNNSDITFQITKATDIKEKTRFFALRLVHYYGDIQDENSKSTSIIDIEEIESIISTLNYAKEHRNEMQNYAEVFYTTKRGLRIGIYVSDIDSKVFVEFSPEDSEYINISEIDKVIDIFANIQKTIKNEQTI